MIRPQALWLFPLALLLAGNIYAGECVSPSHVHTAVNEAGELWASIDGAPPERLISETQHVRPILAPGGVWLALEARLMSNVTVVRLFRRNGNRFNPWTPDITGAAWRDAGTSGHFNPESVEGPQTFVVGWGEKGKEIVLSLRGVWGDPPEAHETIVTIALEQDDKCDGTARLGPSAGSAGAARALGNNEGRK